MSEEKQMFSVSEQPSTTLTIEDVIVAVEQYHPRADFDLIRRAYAFGAEAHKEQKRRSGIPYISHPLAVAHILTQLKMDAMTIASALLHDTIEDTGVTAQQVAELFVNDVAVLVEGVTKLSKLEFASREERQAESFRKMVVAMAKDIRVILVKLADRLHNLRTLEYMPEPKQRTIAQETLDIYAPLAHRLGIAWIQSELEDLSFCYANTRAYSDIQAKLASTQEARAPISHGCRRSLPVSWSKSISRAPFLAGRSTCTASIRRCNGSNSPLRTFMTFWPYG